MGCTECPLLSVTRVSCFLFPFLKQRLCGWDARSHWTVHSMMSGFWFDFILQMFVRLWSCSDDLMCDREKFASFFCWTSILNMRARIEDDHFVHSRSVKVMLLSNQFVNSFFIVLSVVGLLIMNCLSSSLMVASWFSGLFHSPISVRRLLLTIRSPHWQMRTAVKTRMYYPLKILQIRCFKFPPPWLLICTRTAVSENPNKLGHNPLRPTGLKRMQSGTLQCH